MTSNQVSAKVSEEDKLVILEAIGGINVLSPSKPRLRLLFDMHLKYFGWEQDYKCPTCRARVYYTWLGIRKIWDES